MATPATLEQWKELYDLAIEITKLRPWNSYWNMDLIAVETKKNEEPNFVSIMGKSGTCTGISVYRGMEGYSDFCQICNADYNVPATFVMSETALLVIGEIVMKSMMKCIQLSNN